jgi:hypothetical protein
MPLFHLLPRGFVGILAGQLLVFLFLLCGQLLVLLFLLRSHLVLLMLIFLVELGVPSVGSRRTGVRLQFFRIVWSRWAGTLFAGRAASLPRYGAPASLAGTAAWLLKAPGLGVAAMGGLPSFTEARSCRFARAACTC